MNTYIILIRGINVGGKNKVPMAVLKAHLEELGFTGVVSYIASGSILLQSEKHPDVIKTQIEELLPKKFKLDSTLIKVLVLTGNQLKSIVECKPRGFGEDPKKYYSDVVFLIGIDVSIVMPILSPKKGVDTVWPGKNVIYFQRVAALRTESHLRLIIGTPVYQSMTIRNWNMTTKLLELAEHIS